MANKYMHLIDGAPAHYWKGEQICFSHNGLPLKFAKSLQQIRREQAASNAWRVKQGFQANTDLGYLRVKV